MKRASNETIKNHPDQEVRDLADEADIFHALDVLSKSEGGKILIKNLTVDIVSNLDTLLSTFRSATVQEMVASCASMKNQLDLLRTLTRAKKNKKFTLDALEEALKE